MGAFGKSFEKSFNIGQQKGADLAMVRLKAKIAEEADIRKEQREQEKADKGRDYLFEKLGVPEEEREKLKGTDIDPEKILDLQDRWGEHQLNKTQQTLEEADTLIGAKPTAAANNFQFSLTDRIKSRLADAGFTEAPAKFPAQVSPASNLRKRIPGMSSIEQAEFNQRQGQIDATNALAASKHNLQAKIAEIDSVIKAQQASLNDILITQKQKPTDLQEAKALEKLEGKRGVGSKRQDIGFSTFSWLGVPTHVKALLNKLDLSAVDKGIAARVQKSLEDKLDVRSVFEGMKVKENHVKMVAAIYEISEEEARQKIGVTKEDVKKRKILDSYGDFKPFGQ